MALKLTKKQKRLMEFLQDFQNNHEYSPSYREIAAGLGLRSVASVAEHIDHLEPFDHIPRSHRHSYELKRLSSAIPSPVPSITIQ